MKRILLLIVAISTAVIAYGYWHSITHASVNIDLSLKNADHQFLSKAEVLFMDADGKVLARGVRDEAYDFVHLIHPEAGDCHEVAKAASAKDSGKLWQQCFGKQSVWIPTWIKEARQVQVVHKNCLSANIPFVLSKYNSEWLLWWVPLPHVGGKPYSNFRSSIMLEEKDCIERYVQ